MFLPFFYQVITVWMYGRVSLVCMALLYWSTTVSLIFSSRLWRQNIPTTARCRLMKLPSRRPGELLVPCIRWIGSSLFDIYIQYSILWKTFLYNIPKKKNSFVCNNILWRAYGAKPKLILHAYTEHRLIDPLIFYRCKRFHDKSYTLLIPIFGINYSNWEHFAEHFAIFESTTPWHMNHMSTNPSVEYFDLIRFWSTILLNIACTTSFDLIAFCLVLGVSSLLQ